MHGMPWIRKRKIDEDGTKEVLNEVSEAEDVTFKENPKNYSN